MTNKTKLLPCPCCGGEAKEMYTYLTSVEWVACLKCGLETKGFGNAEAAAKAWNTRAAPAEDVRAVVEEHAVWVAESDLSTGTKHAFMARGVPLYRRAQRPLVLPEEFSKRTSYDCDEAYGNGWNACLDAVEELNK